MKKATKIFRVFGGAIALLSVSAILVLVLSASNSIGVVIGVFLLIVLPFGNIGYSMIFKRPEDGSFTALALYVYSALIAALGVFGILMGEPLAIW